MRFMILHKVDARGEAGERPSQPLIEEMGRLVGRARKAGILLDGAGLHRSATRVRLTFEGRRRTVVHGPYAGGNELLAGFVRIVAASMDEAIELATRFAEVSGDREIEIGPVVEGWDLAGAPRPPDAPHRFLLLRKAGRASEAGAAGSPEPVRELLAKWKDDGVLEAAATLEPSRSGARSRPSGGQRRWTDGPFAEAKELVGGFAILELPGLAEARTFADEYAAILGENEIEVRGVAALE